MNRVPVRIRGIDTSRYCFDPLTKKIIETLDDASTVKQLINTLGAEKKDVISRLTLLKQGGLIHWSSEKVRPPRVKPTPRPRISRPRHPIQRPLKSPPKRAEESETINGAIAEKNAEALLKEATDASFSGAICFQQDADAITFYFDRGTPKGAHSKADRHDHGTLLKKEGLIDETTLRRYRSAMADNPDPIDALRQAGIPDRVTMARLVIRRGQALFNEVMAWSEGTYQIKPNTPFPKEIARCHLHLLAKRPSVWRKGRLTDDQMQFLSDNNTQYMVPKEDFKRIVGEMRFDEKETRFVNNMLKGAPVQISRAVTFAPFFRAKAYKILFLLIQRGAFELHRTNPDGDSPLPLNDLEPYRKFLAVSTHFDVIGAHAVSIEDDIKSRYKQRLRQFDPKRYKDAGPDHLATLEAILKRIEKAWEVLGHEESRREYRKQICSPFQLENYFRLQLEKAQAALHLRSDPKEAIPLAISAWDLKPGHIVVRNILATSFKSLARHSEARQYEK